MEEAIKQKKDKTELVRKLALTTGILAFSAILFGLLSCLIFVVDDRLLPYFACFALAITLTAIVLAIIIGVFFLKFDVKMIKMKNKTAAITNIVLGGSIVIVAILSLVIGSLVYDMLIVGGLVLAMLIGIALGVIDILIVTYIDKKNKNPEANP